MKRPSVPTGKRIRASSSRRKVMQQEIQGRFPLLAAFYVAAPTDYCNVTIIYSDSRNRSRFIFYKKFSDPRKKTFIKGE